MTSQNPSATPRILFVAPIPPPYAGVEQVSQLLLSSPAFRRANVRLIRANIRSSNAKKGAWNLSGILKVFSIAARLFSQLVSFKPDVVYLPISQNHTGLCRDCLYIACALIRGRPVVGHLHGSQLHLFLNRQAGVMQKFYLFFLRRLTLCIVLSESIRRQLEGYLRAEQMVTIYNGVEVPRAVTPVQGDVFNVAFMGHLSVAKGFYDVIKVAERLLPKHPNLAFVFAGERLDNERNVAGMPVGDWSLVEKMMRRYPGQIEIKGIVSGTNKRKFLQEAQLFVLPSRAEAFPIAVLEAMAQGLPVLVTGVGALPEVLKSTPEAFVAPGDVQQLSDKIEALMKNPEMVKAAGQRNREIVKDYTFEKMGEAVLAAMVTCSKISKSS